MNAIRAWRPVLLPVALAAAALLAWQYGVVWAKLPPSLLVTPAAVLGVIAATHGLLLQHAVPTAIQLVVGFAAAAGLGFALGVALTASRRLRQALYPHIVLFQLMPKIAVAPLFIVWLGVGPASSLTMAIFLAFFPMLVATMTGLVGTDRLSLLLCRSLTATPWQIFWHVRLPYALTYIFDGLKIASIMSMVGLVVGEFVAAQAGLGYLVLFGSSLSDTGLMFAAVTVLCVLGLALYGAVALLERLVMRRLGIPPLAAQF